MSLEEAQELFDRNLPIINRAIDFVCGKKGLSGADAEDFASAARLKLIDDEYQVLRKWRRASSLATYVAMVVENLYLDELIRRMGRWRTSTLARRLGPAAELLEKLLYQERRPLSEALPLVRQLHPDVARAELESIAAGLRPRRERPTTWPLEDVPDVPHYDTAEEQLLLSERYAAARRVSAILAEELSRCSPEEQLLVKFHFVDSLKVSTIARSLHVSQMPLYATIRRMLRRLRDALSRSGIGWREAREIVAHGAIGLDIAFDELLNCPSIPVADPTPNATGEAR